MTTTEVPLGIDEGKPSSRVLRPPGGGSSFSLGMGPVEPRPQQPRQSASDAAQGSTTETPSAADKVRAPQDNTLAEGQSPAEKNSSACSSHTRIFGDASPVTPTGSRTLAKGASPFNPITGEIYPGFERLVSDSELVRYGKCQYRDAKGRTDPITGQGPEKSGNQTSPATQEKPVNQASPATQPAVKVRQPPGGFSHGIF